MNHFPRPRIIFITGTDTGVGKTVLTASLLYHLRDRGVAALAMKPFCTGDRSDALTLAALQVDALGLDEINPFFFPEPVAPLVAARHTRRAIALAPVSKQIRRTAARCQVLLVEGAGGLLAPLGERFSALELIQSLNAEVIVAAGNRLGTINHARLTSNALQAAGVKCVRFVLLDTSPASARQLDPSCRTNLAMLEELLAPAQICQIPYLGRKPARIAVLQRHRNILKKKLAPLLL